MSRRGGAGQRVRGAATGTRPARTHLSLLAVVAAVVVLAIAAVIASGAGATVKSAGKHPQLSEQRIRKIAMDAVKGSHPWLIQHAAGTREVANKVAGGGLVYSKTWSYLIAIAVSKPIIDQSASRPPSAPAPRGSVVTLVVNARTGKEMDYGLGDDYPDMHKLGKVTTDLRRKPPREVTVPAATDRGLSAAYSSLHFMGLRVSYPYKIPAGTESTFGCEPTIASQTPAAGSRVRRGTTVTLTEKHTLCGLGSPGVPTGKLPVYKVPDFVGDRVIKAVRWADKRDLYWDAGQLPALVRGNAKRLLGNYRITSQHPKPGAKIKLGTGHSSDHGASGSFTPTPLRVQAKLIG